MKLFSSLSKTLFLSISVFALSCCGSTPTSSVLSTSSEESTSEQPSTVTTSKTSSSKKPRNAKVVIMCGQSNMEGKSYTYALQEKVSKEKFAEYSEGYTYPKMCYKDSGGRASRDNFGNTTFAGCPTNGFGPEVGFGEYLNENYLEEDVYIIKYAWGDTSIYPGIKTHNWTPPSWNEGTQIGDCYQNCVDYVNRQMQKLIDKNINAKIVGFLWMQGEADAWDGKASANYKAIERMMFDDFEKDFKEYLAFDRLHVVDAAIWSGVNGRTGTPQWANHTIVNKAKKDIAEEDNEYRHYLDSNEHGLTCTQERSCETTDIDYAHFDSLSMIELGRLFAETLELTGALY